MVHFSKLVVLACTLSAEGATSAYILEKSYVGSNFFDADSWDWFTAADPTEGAVDYVSMERALELGMVNATEKRVYIGPGLQVVTPGTDATHPWPTWGEADFLEGAHRQNEVRTTLHTLQGCDQSAMQEGIDFSGSWAPGLDPDVPATNCSIKSPGQGTNEGCPIVGPEGTMGPMFNAAGGGTFAWEWNPAAGFIRGYFWASGQEPADVKSQSPQPDSWGIPYSKFLLSEAACPTSLFQNMKIIINTDFCGQWDNLDVTFHEKCPEVPAELTCPEWVSTYPGNLTEAFWSITRMDVFQPKASEEVVLV